MFLSVRLPSYSLEKVEKKYTIEIFAVLLYPLAFMFVLVCLHGSRMLHLPETSYILLNETF